MAPPVRVDGPVRLIFSGKSSDRSVTLPSRNRHEPRYRQGVQGVSNRSNVFRIELRFAAFAGGQNLDVFSLYSTWNTAFPALAKEVV